jgi:hypothetical protein
LAPAIFPFVKILRQPNLNVASWNFHSRRVEFDAEDPDRYRVNGEPLVFYHFSGVGPKTVHTWMRERFRSGSGALARIEATYAQLLKDSKQEALAQHRFGYDYFSNGERVETKHRLAYRNANELVQAFPNPFLVEPGGPSFYEWCVEHLAAGEGRTVKKSAIPIEEAVYRMVVAEYYVGRYPDAGKAIDNREYASASAHYVGHGGVLGYHPNPFFDTSFYWSQAHDLDVYLLQASGKTRSPLQHFLEVGLQQRLRPSEFFENEWYEAVYPDVASAVRNGRFSCGFEHYVLFGHRERRSPGPEFNERDYLAANPDIATSASADPPCAYEHYLTVGRAEGRPIR